MTIERCRHPLLLLLVILWLPWGAAAQKADDAQSSAVGPAGQTRFDQGTPLATTQGFMRAAELDDYELASTYLDLRYLPVKLADPDAARLAEQLYIVVARKLRIDFDALSSDPEGFPDDNLPSYRDELGQIPTPLGGRVLYLQRIPGPNDSNIWRISNATVAQIPELYAQFGYSPVVESFRKLIPKGSFLGAELFKWVVAIITATACAMAWLALAWPISRLITRSRAVGRGRVSHYLKGPIPWVIFVLVGYWVLRDLGLGLTASRLAEGGTLVTLVIVWLLFATINLLRDLYADYLVSRGMERGLMLMRPVSSTIKVVVALLAVTIWLDNIGVNVTALVAGLGVGGLAVALVLQKPLEDIMGAITLYTQQPVRIGQLCTSGDVTGTIEEISLRSTRIRKLDNNVVVIPNSIFATASITNASERKRTLHRQTIRLALATTEAQISNVLEKLREVLDSEAQVPNGQWRVRFVELGEFSKNIEVFAHVATANWEEFLEVAERINLAAVRVMDSQGVKFAQPVR